jgi:DNA-binding transcriptional ArsR family regulator
VATPAQNLDSALRALADGNRRTILHLVRDRPRPVGEIAAQVKLTQQAVSHHLRVLRAAGLVTEQRDGTRHLFLVRPDGFGVVREFLDGFWPARLSALKRAAERAARPAPPARPASPARPAPPAGPAPPARKGPTRGSGDA